DHGVERKAAILLLGLDLEPVVADVTAQDVVGERRLLNRGAVGGRCRWQEAGQVGRNLGHGSLLVGASGTRGWCHVSANSAPSHAASAHIALDQVRVFMLHNVM